MYGIRRSWKQSMISILTLVMMLSSDCDVVLKRKYIEEILNEWIFFTTFCIDSIYLGLLDDEEQSEVITELLEENIMGMYTLDAYSEHLPALILSCYEFWKMMLK